MTLKKSDIIQIKDSHKWRGCLAVVDEVKSFGCQAYVCVPEKGLAYIRLKTEDYQSISAHVIWDVSE